METFVQRMTNKAGEGKDGRPVLYVWAAAVILISLTTVLYLGRDSVSRWAGQLGDSILNQSYFSVQEIKVSGGKKIGGSEIVALAGMSRGMNIWKIDPGVIEKRVAKHPWVKRVLVRRELPRRVVIEVEEREAKGIVVLGKLYYIDSEGSAFKALEDGEKTDFPLLTGLRQTDLVSQSHATRQKIREALKLGDLMARGPFALSEIHFSPQGGVVLYPIAFPVALHMGWGDWPGKLERLERVLAMWKGKESRLAALDLSFRDQAVARIRKTERLKG